MSRVYNNNIFRKVPHTIQTNYFMKCTKDVSCWLNRPKTLLEQWKHECFLIGVLININYFLTIHYYINLVKGCSNYLLSLGLLESSITWPCLLFWYMYDANATLAQWQKIPFANESIFLPSAQPGIQRLHFTNFCITFHFISIIINII